MALRAGPFPVWRSLSLQLEGDPAQPAGKAERHGVVVADRRPRVLADVRGFVERKAGGDGPLDPPFGEFFPGDGQGAGTALPGAPAVIVEVKAQRVVAGRQRLLAGHAVLVLLLVRGGVDEGGLALEQQQAPAAEAAPLS